MLQCATTLHRGPTCTPKFRRSCDTATGEFRLAVQLTSVRLFGLNQALNTALWSRLFGILY